MSFKIITVSNSVRIESPNGSTITITKDSIVPKFISTEVNDTFTKRVVKFIGEFYALYGGVERFSEILNSTASATSWRNFGNNLKRAANIYCTTNKILSNESFQKKWFYEGTMEGRTTYGANAPWLDEATPKIVENKKEKNTEEVIPKKSKKNKDFKPFQWDMTREWDIKNKPIFEALGIEIEGN